MEYLIGIAVVVVVIAGLAALGNRRRRGNTDDVELGVDTRRRDGLERTLRQQSRGRH